MVGMSRAPDPRPTLKDVARLAGTSIKTVSRVVNHEGTVSRELTDRANEAISTLGYRRDDRARRLRSGTMATDSIGLIVINLGDPFFAAAAEGVESVASERGVVLVTASSRASPDRLDAIVESLVSRRIDGLIVVEVGGDIDSLERETSRGTPVVFLDLMPSRPVGDVVLSDHRAAAVTAVVHLLAGGHRRIGFLGLDLSIYSMSERYRGYEQALAGAGIDLDPRLIALDLFEQAAASAAVDQMLDLADPPSALFAAYGSATIGAIRSLQAHNAHQTVALVSSDDIEAGDLLSPGLTTTPQDPFELGRSAARFLFRRLDGYDGPFETHRIELELTERGSGEIRPDARWG